MTWCVIIQTGFWLSAAGVYIRSLCPMCLLLKHWFRWFRRSCPFKYWCYVSFSLVSLVLSIQTLFLCFIFVGFVGPVHSNIDFLFHFRWFRWSCPFKHWFYVSFSLVSLVLSIQTLILYFIFVGFVGPVHSNYYSIIVL